MKFSIKGIALVEVVIGIGIIAVITIAIGYSITSYTNARAALLDDVKAAYLAEEGYELVQALRNDNWTNFENLSLSVPHYFELSSTTVLTTTTPETVDGVFTRLFILRGVYRDGSDDITASTTSGSTVDDGMREVEIQVGGPSGTTSLTGLFGNIFAL